MLQAGISCKFFKTHVKVFTHCACCGTANPPIKMTKEEYKLWQLGKHAIEACPRLTRREHRFLTSGMCEDCYNDFDQNFS